MDRKWGLRDRYVVDILTPGPDPRLAVAQAVALDTFQDR
ncbi:DNA-directed RNA polymerase delta subunit [Streptomyces phaeochromogenes]|nr:DNA-directed RNA polymerase delta subunit [Streptomyces phaeochromogenes]